MPRRRMNNAPPPVLIPQRTPDTPFTSSLTSSATPNSAINNTGNNAVSGSLSQRHKHSKSIDALSTLQKGGNGLCSPTVSSPSASLSPTSLPQTPSTIGGRRPDCMFYVKGTCTKGDACILRHSNRARFGSHEICPTWEKTLQCDDPKCPHLHPKMMLPSPSSLPGTAAIPVPYPPIPWPRRPDCMFFVRGSCNKGDKCVFRHNENAKNGSGENCPHWLATGVCNDPACTFIHAKALIPSNSSSASSSGQHSPTSPVEQPQQQTDQQQQQQPEQPQKTQQPQQEEKQELQQNVPAVSSSQPESKSLLSLPASQPTQSQCFSPRGTNSPNLNRSKPPSPTSVKAPHTLFAPQTQPPVPVSLTSPPVLPSPANPFAISSSPLHPISLGRKPPQQQTQTKKTRRSASMSCSQLLPGAGSSLASQEAETNRDGLNSLSLYAPYTPYEEDNGSVHPSLSNPMSPLGCCLGSPPSSFNPTVGHSNLSGSFLPDVSAPAPLLTLSSDLMKQKEARGMNASLLLPPPPSLQKPSPFRSEANSLSLFEMSGTTFQQPASYRPPLLPAHLIPPNEPTQDLSNDFASISFNPSAKMIPASRLLAGSKILPPLPQMVAASATPSEKDEDVALPHVVSIWLVPISMIYCGFSTTVGKVCSLLEKDPDDRLARYYGYTTTDCGAIGLVSEQLDPTQTLEHYLESGSPLNRNELLTVCLNIAQGLKYLHSHGIPHGQLSPSCVFVGPQMQVKLFGYGISSIIQAAQNDISFVDDQFFPRKAWFVPPEALSSNGVCSLPSDVYSLGVLMLLALLGSNQPPLPVGVEYNSYLKSCIRCRAKYCLRVPLDAKCDYGFARIIDKCLRLDARKRPSIGIVMDTIVKLSNLSA